MTKTMLATTLIASSMLGSAPALADVKDGFPNVVDTHVEIHNPFDVFTSCVLQSIVGSSSIFILGSPCFVFSPYGPLLGPAPTP